MGFRDWWKGQLFLSRFGRLDSNFVMEMTVREFTIAVEELNKILKEEYANPITKQIEEH